MKSWVFEGGDKKLDGIGSLAGQPFLRLSDVLGIAVCEALGCLLYNSTLAFKVIVHFPKPKQANLAVWTGQVGKPHGIDLKAYARTVASVSAPLAEQVTIFTETTDVHSITFLKELSHSIQVGAALAAFLSCFLDDFTRYVVPIRHFLLVVAIA
jgi:hypothetical protein